MYFSIHRCDKCNIFRGFFPSLRRIGPFAFMSAHTAERTIHHVSNLNHKMLLHHRCLYRMTVWVVTPYSGVLRSAQYRRHWCHTGYYTTEVMTSNIFKPKGSVGQSSSYKKDTHTERSSCHTGHAIQRLLHFRVHNIREVIVSQRSLHYRGHYITKVSLTMFVT
jgi:hypothetical protein